MPLTILIQGGVASGKSTIARLLAERGAILLDCDVIAHEVLEAEVEQVREAFGEAVIGPEGQVDRKALADVVFPDPEALVRLEELVHPGVAARIQAAIRDARTPEGERRRVLLIDAAVADKVGLDESVDLRLFVAASEETRRRRAEQNRGWAPGELKRREERQRSLGDKQSAAHHVVDNDGGLAEAEEHVERFWTDVVDPRR